MGAKPRIFISAVTGEFSSLRQVLRDALTRGGCDVEVQPDFPQAAVDTVEQLDQILTPCDAVVHLVGDKPGSVADAQAVQSFLTSVGAEQLLASRPEIRAALGDFSGLTYTQWEAFLALHHEVPLFVYAPANRDDQFVQRQHVERLKLARRHLTDYEDEADLSRKVMADLMAHFRSQLAAEQLPAVFQYKPNNLPYLSLGSLFKGRSQFLTDLRAKLRATSGHAAAITTKPHAVHGAGGVGKTRAAIEYAWENERDYTALLFITADSPASLDANLAQLTGVLGIEAMQSADDPTRLAAVLQWLQTHAGWLAILDNVDDDEAAQAVRSRLTELRHGHVVITSRISHWSAGVEQLDLDVLDLPSARDYLLEATANDRRPSDTDLDDAEQVARDVGQLALGLEHASAYVNTHGLTLAEYADMWQENAEQILEEFDLQQIEYPREILITWKLSADRLLDEARTLLNILCWFAPDSIPESLLDQAPDDFPVDRPRHALAELTRYSLVRRQRETRVFTVHRLVQATTRYHFHRQTGEADVLKTTLLAALNWLNNSFVGEAQDVRDWPVLEPLQTHVDSVCKQADRHELATAEHPTSRLLNDSALLYLNKARYAEAEPLMRRALAIDQQSYGDQHPNVATDLNNLAQLLEATNRLAEAEPLMRRALAIDQQSYGDQHPEIARDLNNLAWLLKETNRLAEAEPLMRRALAMRKEFLGEEHPDYATSLNYLGNLLRQTNRMDEAEPMLRQAIVIYEKSFEPDHPWLATALNNLASLFQATNRLAEAEPLMRRALAIWEQSLGEEHPKVASGLNNLAQLLQDTNRLAEAERLMRRSLAIDQQSYGDQHPDVGRDLNNLAQLLQDMAKSSPAAGSSRAAAELLAEAEPLMRRALDILRASLGQDHPKTQTVQANYEVLLSAQSE